MADSYIYDLQDIITGDEIMSDTYKLIPVEGGVLWEVDCKKYVKGKDNFRKFTDSNWRIERAEMEMARPQCADS
jgi:hypothetical protein